MCPKRNNPPRMTPYAGRRSRKYLRIDEVDRLINAAGSVGRNRLRDTTIILMMFRHGLRVSEATSITWAQLDLQAGCFFTKRLKNGKENTHSIDAKQIKALKQLRPRSAERNHYVFLSTRKGRLDRSTVYKMIARAGRIAGLEEQVNTHMLRHSCGYHLANVTKKGIRRIQDFLGHRDINHTVVYTELDEHKFDDMWDRN